MNIWVFGKTIHNNRKQSGIQLDTTDKTRDRIFSLVRFKGSIYLPDLYSNIWNLKNKANIDVPLYDGQSTLYFSKMFIYYFYYDYMERKWGEINGQFIYMDINTISCTTNKNRWFFYENIKDDGEKRFDTSNYDKKKHYL